jgi:hypothetical protein
MLAEWDQSRTLLFLGDSRKIKGSIEEALCDLAGGSGGKFGTWIVRPSGLIGEDAGIHKKLFGWMYGEIGTEVVGRGIVSLAMGDRKRMIVENGELGKM